ncbi:thiosulfate oxidation carrier complex protein SoxZ [Thioalkalivibrio paradoxus]|uniref:Sulfur oxidation protein n=1 Tax=Thioalkalivibrio paradoxus ARh 1 TaxID=713585 RepID=W0DJD3_9GAMM|nr:thiosulfate oxidation carrier complex protein SoxZ [Thioalkalivibrio paradoxus]AHE97000.1 sulfur oxidation protein [Thioalkalivibrio paradoxus ARh 1]
MSTIRVRAQESGGIVTVRALMSHPMETGARKDSAGNLVPAHYIETVEAEVGGNTVMTALWGAGISRNPFFQFQFSGSKGDTLKLSWKDNKGESDSTEAEIG